MDKTITLNKHEMVVDRDHYEKLVKALKFIAAWELPEVEHQGKMISYESAYGSNGAHTFMRNTAKLALE